MYFEQHGAVFDANILLHLSGNETKLAEQKSQLNVFIEILLVNLIADVYSTLSF